jgi:hypothetical protein
MKVVEPRPYSDPEAAARKLMEIANSIEFLQEHRGSPAKYKAGLDLAIARRRCLRGPARPRGTH